MPLLKPSAKSNKKVVRLSLPDELISGIDKYCKWANIQKSEDFFEQAAQLVFSKDRDWRKHKEEK